MAIKTKSRYAVHGYETNRYDRKGQVVRSFKTVGDMWRWCREYLAGGDRKVIAYSRRLGRRFGLRSTTVQKIGEYTNAGDVP